MNKVILLGNLTRDPELRQTQSGMSICTFTIAQTEKSKDRENTTFTAWTAFGKTAENIQRFFGKGKPILVEGKITQDNYEDKDGKKQSKIKFIADRFDFVGGDKGNTKPTQQKTSNDDLNDDDVPF